MPIKRILFLILTFATPGIFADEILEPNISVKALGMGNAYISHAKGHDAIFYNPAGFASMQGFQWRVTGLNLGLNGLDVYDEYRDIVDSSENDLPGVLSGLYGQPIWSRLDLQTSISFGSLMIGGFGRSNVGFILQNPALPSLQSAYFADYGLFAGWGVEIVPKYMDFGFLVKRVTRVAGDIVIGPSTLAYLDSGILEDNIERSGTGYGVDWGVKLRAPGSWNPTASFAWQDVGDTTFSVGSDDNTLASIKSRMHVGLAFEKDFTVVKVKPEINFRYINSGGDIQIGKKVHAGAEFEFPVFSLRGGFNQGYYTAGASFDFWLFQVDLATYGVELGEYVGQQEDRRYILQLTMDFGIDPQTGDFFNFSKAKRNNRRAGIKQRR